MVGSVDPLDIMLLVREYSYGISRHSGGIDQAAHRLQQRLLLDDSGRVTSAGRALVESFMTLYGKVQGAVPPTNSSVCACCLSDVGKERRVGSFYHGVFCDTCWHRITSK